MGVASLILGILSVLFCSVPLCGVVAFLPALIGFFLGFFFVVGAFRRKVPAGIGIAGVVLNGIALLVITGSIALVVWTGYTRGSIAVEMAKQFQEMVESLPEELQKYLPDQD